MLLVVLDTELVDDIRPRPATGDPTFVVGFAAGSDGGAFVAGRGGGIDPVEGARVLGRGGGGCAASSTTAGGAIAAAGDC
jgi:hypothetical protein